jgi:hypothetical protein
VKKAWLSPIKGQKPQLKKHLPPVVVEEVEEEVEEEDIYMEREEAMSTKGQRASMGPITTHVHDVVFALNQDMK